MIATGVREPGVSGGVKPIFCLFSLLCLFFAEDLYSLVLCILLSIPLAVFYSDFISAEFIVVCSSSSIFYFSFLVSELLLILSTIYLYYYP